MQKLPELCQAREAAECIEQELECKLALPGNQQWLRGDYKPPGMQTLGVGKIVVKYPSLSYY
jgi:hypothetical protein